MPVLVTRVVVRDGTIEMQFSKHKIQELLLPSRAITGEEEIVSIHEQVEFQRHRREIRLVLPAEDGTWNDRMEPALIKAVARAHDWVDRILNGDVLNQQAIAEETGLDKRYISKIIQLAFLSPDITEAILEGKQPPYLTLDLCLSMIPASWAEQRELMMKSEAAA